ncbi:3-keto-5-aminohexanoate cleavage protein [Streptomyces sp. NPDC046275]|uniref:3-keto-5-aminohexanoate cleavage protein n=1 Tax=Streptomyces sp. NPDC046275 TaxID=3157201 RepID=UPI0033D8455B
MLQVCVNGSRNRDECPWLPLSPAELAEEARAAVAAGAEDVHLHPKLPDGTDTLDPDAVAEVLQRVRAAVPGVPVGVTTGAWAVPDPAERARLVRAWTVLPDHASVNWHEKGADLVAEALLERGIGIEAGIYSGTDAAARFLDSPYADRVLRVLAEVVDPDPRTAPTTAATLLDALSGARRPPILLHGENDGAWPVLRLAATLGLHTRIGLEDVLHDADGTTATGNVPLVTSAKVLLAAGGGA